MKLSKKETLCCRWYELRNEYFAITGQAERVKPLTEEFLNSREFYVRAKEDTIAEWERLIIQQTNSLSEAKRQIKINEWLETDEGKAFKKEYEDNLTDNKRERLALIDKTKDTLRLEIQNILGSKWDILSINSGMVKIGYIKEYKDGYPVEYFGYEIELSLETRLYAKETKTSSLFVSYPSLGNKDILKDESYRQYMIGLGTIADNTELLGLIRDVLIDYTTRDEDIWNRRCEIEHNYKNHKLPEE